MNQTPDPSLMLAHSSSDMSGQAALHAQSTVKTFNKTLLLSSSSHDNSDYIKHVIISQCNVVYDSIPLRHLSMLIMTT